MSFALDKQVLTYLRENPESFSTRGLAVIMKCSSATAIKSLKRLWGSGLVERRDTDHGFRWKAVTT